MSVRTIQNWVGNREHPPAKGAYMDDFGPATGEVIARIPKSDAEDVDAAVTAAQAAMAGSWSQSTPAERADLCEAIADAIESRLDELAELESLDCGKPITTARTVDIPRAVANFRFFAGAVRHDETGCHDMGRSRLNYTLRRPLGVVGLITPWNLPLYLLSWKVAPALACGNAVVAKPSEMTPLTADALGAIVRDIGAPDGVFNLVHGLGPEVGAPLTEHPEVAAISFTGGTATGARVAAAAAPRFKKLSLELGGKNPTIVFDDADLDLAVEGAVRAGFTNTGQVCLCGSRLFVQRGIYDAFVERFTVAVQQLPAGDPSQPQTRVGALISAAHRDKVEGYIALAREEGGTLVAGGGRTAVPAALAGGYYVEPTVVTGLSANARCATEEIFGPVVTVHVFDDEEEVLRLANGVRYGLSASVWTTNLARAHRVSAALDCGMVWVNTWLLRDLRVPFGGMKDSGVGREGGAHSLEFYTEQRNICVTW
ncbi:MAG: aldehyde dehydrogenase [Deltaproteobacteria bacterium]|nr:MAG: aldehyde dehydrogenase [Deltaproteobacteria bacterium]